MVNNVKSADKKTESYAHPDSAAEHDEKITEQTLSTDGKDKVEQIRTVPAKAGGFEEFMRTPSRIWTAYITAVGALVELLLRHFTIQKKYRAQVHCLPRSGDLFFAGQVRDECYKLWLSHVGRMPFVVKEDLTLDPFDVGLFGPKAVMLHSDHFAHLIKQFGPGSFGILPLNPVLCRSFAV